VSKIEIGRLSDQLRRMLGMAGVEQIAAELSPEISPTIELEGRSAQWDFLKGVRGCGGAAEIPRVALGSTRYRLRNPPGSGVMGLVSFFEMVPAADAQLIASVGDAVTNLPLGTVDTTVFDGRWGQSGVARAALILSVDNTLDVAPAGTIWMRSRRLLDEPFRLRYEIPLTPGRSLDWGTETGTLNIRMWSYILWQERGLPALER